MLCSTGTEAERPPYSGLVYERKRRFMRFAAMVCTKKKRQDRSLAVLFQSGRSRTSLWSYLATRKPWLAVLCSAFRRSVSSLLLTAVLAVSWAAE